MVDQAKDIPDILIIKPSRLVFEMHIIYDYSLPNAVYLMQPHHVWSLKLFTEFHLLNWVYYEIKWVPAELKELGAVSLLQGKQFSLLLYVPASKMTAEKSRVQSRRKPSSEPVAQNDEDTLMLLMAIPGPGIQM